MPERDNKESIATEQLAQELLQRIQGAEFGSTVYQAVSDYFDHANLGESLEALRNNSLRHLEDPSRTSYWESELRIEEMKMALLEHEISQREVQTEGYSNVYYHLMTVDEDLYHTVSKDADEKFVRAAEHAIHEIRASGRSYE